MATSPVISAATTVAHAAEEEGEPEGVAGLLNLDLGELDITTEEVELDDLDEDFERYQQDDLVKDALVKGVDLRQYSRQIESDLREVEQASIQDYIKESDNLANLHQQIRTCDGILETMERMLSGFQSDLGNISSEIKHLQDESRSMSIKLRNRKNAEQLLGNFVTNLVVPPELTTAVCESQVNEAYLEFLTELNKKLVFTKSEGVHDTMARQDIEPVLERLRVKAVSKVREFLLQRVYGLKKDKTNVQMLQQLLLKFKYFNQFLMDHDKDAAQEMENAYVDTMSRIYFKDFRAYVGNVMKLHTEISSKTDTLGAEEGQLKSYFSSRISKKGGASFSLGDRDKVLLESEQPSIVYHVAEQNHQKFPYEAIFRSINNLLMCTATSEFMFSVDFFGRTDLFQTIFTKTHSLVLENLENYLFNCYDVTGILLIALLNRQNQFIMMRRRVPCLDAYMDRVNSMLWPRFKTVVELHTDSLRNGKAKDLWTQDIHPHYVARRFAELSSSVLFLAKEMADDAACQVVISSLITMRTEMDRLLLRLASEAKDRKSQVIFLINNCDMILTVYNERGVTSGSEVAHYDEFLVAQVDTYVEIELMESFRNLIQFVKETEPLLTLEPVSIDTSSVERIVREFASNWKGSMEYINSNVMKYFSNFKNGAEILKKVLSQMLLYYTRFLDVRKRCYPSGNAPSRDVVTIPSIMYEIKIISRQTF
eukprot:TRINITY_DN17560_c0_g1_i1.p1 TRINITY_DN17560_c0_g1~~TRINITY_DN17560_c0_g1_i1.p1  ORF type:complete len:764 (-),score=142.62 TRINITY_DN17560_c0_g1_i1:7-2133(-)